MEFEEEKKSGKSDGIDALIIIAGIAFLIWLFKGNQQKQSVQESQVQRQIDVSDTPISTYENAEEWHIVRGDNGYIEDLKVERNATVGNCTQPGKPIQYDMQHERPIIDTSYIDNRIKEMMQKNLKELSKYNNRFERLNDLQRHNRFGFL